MIPNDSWIPRGAVFPSQLIRHSGMRLLAQARNPYLISSRSIKRRSAVIHPVHPFSADSREENGLEANLDLHQFGDRATGLCFCGD